MLRSRTSEKRFQLACTAVCAGLAFTSTASAAVDAEWLNPTTGTWQTGSNWSSSTPPRNGVPLGTTYRVQIDATGSPYGVVFNVGTGSVTVDSVELNSANAGLSLIGGTLTASQGLVVNAGTFHLGMDESTWQNSGTLARTTISGSGGFVYLDMGRLDGVTLARDAWTFNNIYDNWDTYLTVQNGLTLQNATYTVMQSDAYLPMRYAQVYFSGAQTLGGTGMLRLENGRAMVAGKLTIASGITVSGSGAMYYTDGAVDNYGTLRGDAVQPLNITSWSDTALLTNYGLIEATDGGFLAVRGPLDNRFGVLRASNGGILKVGTNLQIGSAFFSTAMLGRFESVSGGQVGLNGGIDNTGRTLTVDNTTGVLELGNSYITGGTLRSLETAYFQTVGNAVGFDNLTLAGRLNAFALERQSVDVNLGINNLTLLNAVISLNGTPGKVGPNIWISSDHAQTLAGTGTILFDGANERGGISGYGGVLTLGPGITVRTGTGGGTLQYHIANDGLIVSDTPGFGITFGSPSAPETITNRGIVRVENGTYIRAISPFVNQGAVSVSGGSTLSSSSFWGWGNSGTITASGGSTLDFSGPWTNTGTLSLTDTTLNTSSGSWSSSGTILSTNSTLNLGGTFTVPASLIRTGGTVNIKGTLLNTPGSLLLNANTGSWNLVSGGKILGGTISTADGARLIGQGGTIESADILGQVSVSSSLTLLKSTIHGVLNSSAGSTTTFTDSINLGGVTVTSGNLKFNGNGSNGANLTAISSTIDFTGSWTNSGTIAGQSASTFNLGGTWSNSGVITLADSTANFSGNWSSSGSIVATNSTINLGGVFTAPVSMTRTGGVVRITGTMQNSPLNLNAGSGSWDLMTGGKVLGGTISTADGAKLVGKGGSIESSNVLGNIDVPALQSLSVLKSTLHGTLATSGAATLTTTTIHGTAAVTSGASMTLTGGTANVGTVASNAGSLYLGDIANSGQMTTSGGTLTFGGAWTNTGTIATSGTVVSLGGSTNAIGTVVFTDSTVNIASNYTTAQLEQMTFVNSQLVAPGSSTITNAGSVLTNGLRLEGGTIVGGTIASAAGAPVVVKFGSIIAAAITGHVAVEANGQLAVTDSTISGTLKASSASSISIGGNWSNAGLVSVAGGTLTLSGAWSNTGTIATTGGSLNIGGTWINTGTIAADGSAVSLAGVPTTVGTANFVNSTVNLTGSHTTSELTLYNFSNSILSLSPTDNLVNHGNTLVATPDMAVRFAGGTLTGGSLASAGAVPSVAAGAVATLNGVTIDTTLNVGSGATLNLTGAWDNNGTIIADSATLSLGGTFTTDNIGTLSRTGGTVRIAGSLNNVGRTLSIDDIGTWQLGTSTITGGKIAVSSGAAFTTGGFLTSPTLDGVTLAAGTLGVGASTTLQIRNGITLGDGNSTASITLGSGILQFANAQSISGDGTIVFNGSGNSSIRPVVALTIGSGILIQSGTRGGTIGFSTRPVTNLGTISSATSGRTISVTGVFSNQGTVEASSGGSLVLPGGTSLSNYNGTTQTLSGGRWRVFDHSTITLGGGAVPTPQVVVNDADVLLSGPNSVFAPIDPLASNLGRFTLQTGRDFTTVGDLYNDGHITVGVGSDLHVTGDLTMGANGSMEVGVATYEPPVGGAGLRMVALAADAPDPEGFGQLTVEGTLTLGGTLVLSLGGYQFAPGDQFTLLSASQITGQFTSVQFAQGLGGTISYSDTGVDFHVTSVPEPAGAGLLMIAGATLLRRRRRRLARYH